MMKVCMVNSFYPPWVGGAERYVSSIAHELAGRGHDVTVYCADRPLAEGESYDGAVRVVRMRTPFTFYGTPLSGFPASFLAEDYDVVHCNFPNPYFSICSAAMSKFTGTPAVLTWHNDLPAVTRAASLLVSAHSAVSNVYLDAYQRIIATTGIYARTSATLRKHGSKVRVIPNGVDAERFNPDVECEWAKDKYGLKGYKTLIFVGALTTWHTYKGLDVLLQAFSLVSRECDKMKLLVVGGGNLLGHYQRLARELGAGERVMFAGRVDDNALPGCYAASDFGVLPSKDSSEGFGLSCLSPQTEVLTENGLRQLGDLKIGERVLTHVGRYQRITGTSRRLHSGKYYRIKIWGLNNHLTITGNHPLLAVRRLKKRYRKQNLRWDEGKLEWIEAERLQVGDAVHFPYFNPDETCADVVFDMGAYSNRSDENFCWFKMGYSSKTGELIMVKRYVDLDCDVAKLLGWYVAEGSCTGRLSTFSLHSKEEDEAKWISATVADKFGLNVTYRKRGNKAELEISSQVLAGFLADKCGVGAENKKISKEILLNRDKSIQRAFLDGYSAGDGGRVRNGVTTTTVSKRLHGELLLLLCRVGLKPSRRQFLNDYGNQTYLLRVRDDNTNFRHSNKSWRLPDGSMVFLVKSKEELEGEVEVCNLSVETDNSYVTLSGTVHNCLEAMACGKAVIGSDVGGIPEVIDNWKTGVLVAPKDPEALANAIHALYMDDELRNKMGAAGREFALTRDWGTVADRVSSLYREVQ